MRDRIAPAIAAAVCALAAIFAQNFGSVSGTVTDPAGAAISGASVELSNSGIGFSRNTTTDDRGEFRFVSVPSGSYRLSVTSPGFIAYRSSIEVSPQGATTVRVTLNVGAVAETVQVSASTASSRPRRIPARGIRRASGKFNTEQYDAYQENDFADVRRNPLSTFGADVDTASYSNVRRFLRQGRLPPPDSVRIEELVNYFAYDYPEPGAGEPFSVTASVASCPWRPEHKLLHVGLRTRPIDFAQTPPANLVFLIDVSGSMADPNKLPLVKKSLRLLVEQLRARDRVSIAVYAGAAGAVLAPTPGDEKARIMEAIDELRPGGSTHGSAGIRLAYDLARESFLQEGNNRVILATDGDFNVGVSSDGELVRLIESQRDSGVYLTVLGFGMGNYKDSKMEKLADRGNGNYAYIDTLEEARKALVEQISGTLFTVAKDVKLQVEFNPARVKAYRLIGYENRILRPEEFNDDRKDAGDLGAGTAVTALWELIPASSGEETPGVDQLRYQETPRTTRAARGSEIATLKFRYKPPAENKSRLFTRAVEDSRRAFAEAPDEMRFASAVAEYGLLLRQSKFAGAASFPHVLKVAGETRGQDRGGYRAEFVDLVKTAMRLESPD
jgi:Ca-activated chloride channel family protein